MSVKKLRVAVDCCTRRGGWESTCGKCPFRNREKEKENDPRNYDVSCIDKLIQALAEYLPKENEE